MSERSVVTPEFRARVRRAVVPIALGLGRLGLTPNALTMIGFGGTCAAALAAAAQAWLLAGVLVLAFGIFDLFDGALARASGRASAFGAFLDSTLDRLGENLVYAGIVVGCAVGAFPLGAGLAALAMAAASVVTYTRARAEAVGLHGEVGIAPRPERLVLVSTGLTVAGLAGGISVRSSQAAGAGQVWLTLALGLIAVTSFVTVVQRIVHVQRQAQSRRASSGRIPGPGEE